MDGEKKRSWIQTCTPSLIISYLTDCSRKEINMVNNPCASAEMRDLPKGLSVALHSEMLQMCDRGIRNCIQLRSCAWTRDASLQSTMLESLAGCSQFQELEINGNDSGYYAPVLLIRFSHLSKISLITMPSAHVLPVVVLLA
jgi:hypothetical protein